MKSIILSMLKWMTEALKSKPQVTPEVSPTSTPEPVEPAPAVPAPLSINELGVALIKHCEGFEAKAYLDIVGVLTIGYGSTTGVEKGQTITEEEASARLLKELKEVYEPAVRDVCSHLKLNQSQFSALVSFTYNLGKGNLQKLVAKRDEKQIEQAICLYHKAGGQPVLGLKIRRALETELFKGELTDIKARNVYYKAYFKGQV